MPQKLQTFNTLITNYCQGDEKSMRLRRWNMQQAYRKDNIVKKLSGRKKESCIGTTWDAQALKYHKSGVAQMVSTGRSTRRPGFHQRLVQVGCCRQSGTGTYFTSSNPFSYRYHSFKATYSFLNPLSMQYILGRLIPNVVVYGPLLASKNNYGTAQPFPRKYRVSR